MSPSRFSVVATAGVLTALACSSPSPESREDSPAVDDAVKAAAQEIVPDGHSAAIPASMESCAECHLPTVRLFLEHGMSRSIGPIGEPPEGTVENPLTGNRYTISRVEGEPRLVTRRADGGRRTQRLVGRIGAGIFDTSYASEEIDPNGGGTGRLFFAPVEEVIGHGLELAPFDLYATSPGPDFGLTDSCLTCHTLSHLDELPQAAVAGTTVFPGNALGGNAFDELAALDCGACHGDGERHVAVMRGEVESDLSDLGLPILSELGAGEQRDRCARCHLQGEARVELFDRSPDPTMPLAGQLPTLVAGGEPGDDFRFVGQLERLALSACFRGVPEMTCTTCHDAHRSVSRQAPASFDAACAACHEVCSRPEELDVESVTGHPARTGDGCVDCHVRRSQPFDLPHVRTADHYVRREISRPETDIPHRQFTDRQGPFELYDDGRLAAALATEAGARWRDGNLAMGLLTAGRIAEAAALFDRFPEPGSEAARTPSAPAGLTALETHSGFHQMRALSLLASGRIPAALNAFDDALTVDPANAGARLERARVRLDTGDVRGGLIDTEEVIRSHPQADAPWRLRAAFALRVGRLDLAREALEKVVELWPPDAAVWLQLGRIYQELGNEAQAEVALARARALQPSLTDQAGTAPGAP